MRAQRVALEEIAARTEVRVPNGEWNCQDWVIEVLVSAVDDDLISPGDRDAALSAARGEACVP
jgi:hypothetical protein